MKVSLIVKDNQYSEETVKQWQDVWETLCDMCYHQKNVQESIITYPGQFELENELDLDALQQDHCDYYERRKPTNDEEITLDYTWKKYKGEVSVVPELKKIYVPVSLFNSLGVKSWFRYCFPNCEISYW